MTIAVYIFLCMYAKQSGWIKAFVGFWGVDRLCHIALQIGYINLYCHLIVYEGTCFAIHHQYWMDITELAYIFTLSENCFIPKIIFIF